MPPADLDTTRLPAGMAPVRIWDLPVRLFHWLLVALLGFSWWSGKRHDMDWHRLSGYAILALLIFRLCWGFIGGRTARFAHFVRGPRAVFAYAGEIVRGRHVATAGHNPIGGWSVVVMLATLAAMVVSGLFAVDVDGLESGPLADYVDFDRGRAAAAVHHWLFDAILVLVSVHVLAIAFYLVRLRHDLIGPMIHGRRRTIGNEPAEELGASAWAAAAGIVIAIGAAYVVARGFRL